MTAFLSWIYNQASNFYLWFSSSFGGYLNTVKNTWSWIVSQSNNAYDRAIAWSKGEINYVGLNINNVYAWATAQLQGVRTYANGLVEPVWNTILYYYNAAVNYATGKYNDLAIWWIAEKSLLESNFHTWVTAQISAIRQVDLGPFTWVLTIKDSLTALLTALTPDLMTGIIDLVKTELANIKTFFQDPLGFILNIIWPRFITYLSYAIAYALGTVTETLPPLPPWGSSGGVFIPGPGPGPGGSGSGLSRPLAGLYVSGYIFGPVHKGTDFGLMDGQPVFAAHAGTVGEADFSKVGYGFTVTINGSTWWTRYGHLKQLLVMPGQQVSAGETIAYGDSTGNSTGPHLHFEVKRDGVFVDPVTVL